MSNTPLIQTPSTIRDEIVIKIEHQTAVGRAAVDISAMRVFTDTTGKKITEQPLHPIDVCTHLAGIIQQSLGQLQAQAAQAQKDQALVMPGARA